MVKNAAAPLGEGASSGPDNEDGTGKKHLLLQPPTNRESERAAAATLARGQTCGARPAVISPSQSGRRKYGGKSS